jgi:hypothetical protein
MTTKKRAALKKKVRSRKVEPSKKALPPTAKATRRPGRPKGSFAKTPAQLPELSEVLAELARRIAIRWHDGLSRQSEKRAEKLQKLFEESRRALTMAADFAFVRSAMADHVMKAQGYGLPRLDIPAFRRLARPQLDQIEFDTSTIKARLGALRVAGAGWTVADWLAPGYVASLDGTAPKVIDGFFVERYRGGVSFKGHMRFTAEELRASPQLKPWKPLLRQILQSIKDEKYVLCVPALISLIEEFVSESLLRNIDVPRPRVEKGRWRGKHTMDALIWSSSVVFLSQLFGNAHFENSASSKPALPSAHEGAAAKWLRADAFKLIHALGMFDWVLKPES